MSSPSFRVYIDESGEEGFVFRPDGTGSSRWLILSAVVTRRENDLQVVRLMERVRQTLGRPPKQALHFCKLGHAQRVVWAREIAQTPLRTVSVLIHKPSIREPERFQSQKHLLYRYASRYLLERVSWLCRDHRKPDTGNGQAEVIFSNRSQMSYDEMRGYLRKLREETGDFGATIDWSVLNPEAIRAVEHSQLRPASGGCRGVQPVRRTQPQPVWRYRGQVRPPAAARGLPTQGGVTGLWPEILARGFRVAEKGKPPAT